MRPEFFGSRKRPVKMRMVTEALTRARAYSQAVWCELDGKSASLAPAGIYHVYPGGRVVRYPQSGRRKP